MNYRAHISLEIDFNQAECDDLGLDPEQFADRIGRHIMAALESRIINPFTCTLDDITEPDDAP